MKGPLNMDEKWEIVQKHYERAYRVRFKVRLSDEEIEKLHSEYLKLYRSEQDFKNAKMNYNIRLIHSI